MLILLWFVTGIPAIAGRVQGIALLYYSFIFES